MYTSLQQREVFHLSFLKLFVRRVRPDVYALKGGVNLRFFCQSPRYSEDIDLDIQRMPLHALKKIVMDILDSEALQTSLKPFQIEGIRPPDISKAKQTETVQRFKVHLLTAAGEDLFTKIEFSRRGRPQGVRQEPIPDAILFVYKQAPLIVSHYSAETAFKQKIEALLGRPAVQTRDVFDLFILLPQIGSDGLGEIKKQFSKEKRDAAARLLAALNFAAYRNTVCAYLSEDDRLYYERPEMWEIILQKVEEVLR